LRNGNPFFTAEEIADVYRTAFHEDVLPTLEATEGYIRGELDQHPKKRDKANSVVKELAKLRGFTEPTHAQNESFIQFAGCGCRQSFQAHPMSPSLRRLRSPVRKGIRFVIAARVSDSAQCADRWNTGYCR